MLQTTEEDVRLFWTQGILTPEMRETCITQDELRRLRELRSLLREYELLRDSIRSKVQRGAPFEAGELTLDVRETENRAFSFDKLARIVGREGAQRLKDRIEPTVSIRLNVVPTARSEDNGSRSGGGDNGF